MLWHSFSALSEKELICVFLFQISSHKSCCPRAGGSARPYYTERSEDGHYVISIVNTGLELCTFCYVILCIRPFVISGHFISFDIQQCHANRLFCNKIWQATKYVRMCIQNVPAALDSDLRSSQGDLSKLDKWILSRLAHMVSEVNKALAASDFHIATSALKTFLYSEFCDFYLVSRQHWGKVPGVAYVSDGIQ